MRSTAVILNPPANETPVLFESLAGDLQAGLGWPRLLQLVLDAVLAQPRDSISQSTRPAVLLTLVTYCYATRTFSSQDIEDATTERPEVAYITRGMSISSADIRQFRRTHRARIENCLEHVLKSAMNELVVDWLIDRQVVTSIGVAELARSWVSQAVLFDTAFSE